MFGRKKKESLDNQPPAEVAAQPVSLAQLGDGDPIWGEPGPRTAEEVDTSIGYVDMGSLRFPVMQGMQLQTQMAADGKTIQKILLVIGNSGLQIMVAAAPRSGGVWEELRAQIQTSIEADGGLVEAAQTRYGTELRANLRVTMPDGTQATSPMRIIGREGPRWFARIDVLGPAVTDEERSVVMERVIDQMVVARDDQPRARLDLLPLRIPDGVVEAPNV